MKKKRFLITVLISVFLPTSTPTLTPENQPELEPEPFLTTLVATASFASVVVFAVLLSCFKKRKRRNI